MAHALLDISDQMVVASIDNSAICLVLLNLLDQLVSDFLASNIDCLHSVGKGVTLEDRDCVCDAFS